MLKLKYKQVSEYKKQVIFVNPKCGHTQTFEYNIPYVCQHSICTEKPIPVDKLIGSSNQDARVKYFDGGII
jgi:hypothetical protein